MAINFALTRTLGALKDFKFTRQYLHNLSFAPRYKYIYIPLSSEFVRVLCGTIIPAFWSWLRQMFCKMLIIALIALISKYLHLRRAENRIWTFECLSSESESESESKSESDYVCICICIVLAVAVLLLRDWCTASSGPTTMLMTSWNVCFNKCGVNCAFYAANEAWNRPSFDVCPGQILMNLRLPLGLSISNGCTRYTHFKDVCLLSCDVISFCISSPPKYASFSVHTAPRRINAADVWNLKWCLSRTLGRW